MTRAFRAALAGLLAAGCATAPPQAPVALESAGMRLAVLRAPGQPQVELELLARESAPSGAAAAFLDCTSAFSGGSCSGAVCGAVALIWLGVCGAAGVVGALSAASRAPGPPEREQAKAQLAVAAGGEAIQESLRAEVAAFAASRAVTLVEGGHADLSLEVGLSRVALLGAGTREPSIPVMEGYARLRAADGRELQVGNFAWSGPGRSGAEWRAGEGAALRDALAAGYQALGRHAYEQTLVVYRFPDDRPASAGLLSAAFGLAPLDPPTRGQPSGDGALARAFEWTRVPSLRPTLRWEAFPRVVDRSAAPEEMRRVRAVRYDLVIAREEQGQPGRIVYRREGLPSPEHALEAPLEPAHGYFWTVRARFDLDGRERLSDWGTTHWAARGRLASPSAHSYRFRTP